MNTASLYVTVADVLGRYPPVGSISAVDSGTVAMAIAYEQSIVDARLAGRFTVPFFPPPPLIQTIVGDMAIYRLVTTRVLLKEQREGDWVNAWSRSIRILEGLAAGSMSLISGSGTVVGQSAMDGAILASTSNTSTPTFIGQDFGDVLPPKDLWRP